MPHPKFPYDPDLPYVVYSTEDGTIMSRHRIEYQAMAEGRGSYAWVDTSPARRIPRHVNMIVWYEWDSAHYARRLKVGGDQWEVRYRNRAGDYMDQTKLEEEINRYTIHPLTSGEAI